MTMIRKVVGAEIRALGEDEVEVIMSTAALARDGHILVPQGCRLDNYRANPIVLWGHDPDFPIGNSDDIVIEPEQIRARIRFAPLGISAKADEIRGLMKAGVVRAVSVGFDPLDGEPLNPSRPKGGQRFTDWELLELSVVSVGSDANALVTARAKAAAKIRDGEAARSEEESQMADGSEAGAAPEEGGTPEGERGKKPAAKRENRAQTRTGGAAVTLERGLYQVASLCYMLEELGWQLDLSKYEASMEGDGSKVPAMLATALTDLGDALLAMTAEEIAELLAGHDVEPEEDDDDEVLVVEERQHVRAATNPRVRAFRRGLAQAKLRAGKTLSAETVRCLRDALAMHDEAMDMHRSAMRKHKDGAAAIGDMLDRAGVSDPEDDATQTVQTSEGTGVDEGSEGQRSPAEYRRRQADLLALSGQA